MRTCTYHHVKPQRMGEIHRVCMHAYMHIPPHEGSDQRLTHYACMHSIYELADGCSLCTFAAHTAHAYAYIHRHWSRRKARSSYSTRICIHTQALVEEEGEVLPLEDLVPAAEPLLKGPKGEVR